MSSRFHAHSLYFYVFILSRKKRKEDKKIIITGWVFTCPKFGQHSGEKKGCSIVKEIGHIKAQGTIAKRNNSKNETEKQSLDLKRKGYLVKKKYKA